MVSSNYMLGRVKWARPQALLFSNDAGTLDNGIFVPQGSVEGQDFIILSDHGRGEINLTQNRIENRLRTINATMRSYHTADKLNLSCSWSNIPSRSFSNAVTFDSDGKPVYDLVDQEYYENGLPKSGTVTTEYTVDGGAGGVEMIEWYENHPGPFYVYLSYDKYTNFNTDKYNHLNQYSQVLHMYFASFDYNVIKRGATNYDMWNISLTLEEV